MTKAERKRKRLQKAKNISNTKFKRKRDNLVGEVVDASPISKETSSGSIVNTDAGYTTMSLESVHRALGAPTRYVAACQED